MLGAPISKALPNLYIGSAVQCRNEALFTSFKITHIVSLHRAGIEYWPDILERLGITLHHIDELDSSDVDLSKYFESTIEFITEARLSGGVVFIHCAMGVSRAGTMTLSYLMTSLEIDLKEALAYLRLRRPVVHPNDGFMAQLEEFEKVKGKLHTKLVNQFGKDLEKMWADDKQIHNDPKTMNDDSKREVEKKIGVFETAFALQRLISNEHGIPMNRFKLMRRGMDFDYKMWLEHNDVIDMIPLDDKKTIVVQLFKGRTTSMKINKDVQADGLKSLIAEDFELAESNFWIMRKGKNLKGTMEIHAGDVIDIVRF